MAVDFLNFPVEIQEKILGELNGRSLYLASKVCRLWLEICAKLINRTFGKMIPAECVQEAEENSHLSLEETWMNTLNLHCLQKCLINNMLDYKITFGLELTMNQHLCYCSYGSIVFFGNQASKIHAYDIQNNPEPKIELHLEDGPIYHLEVAGHEDTLIVVTSNGLQFWTLPSRMNSYKMTRLKIVSENYSEVISSCSNRNVSICGSSLGVITKYDVLSLFNIKRENDELMQLSYLGEFKTLQAPIMHTAIWNGEVIMLLVSGEVVVWHTGISEWSCVDAVMEIKYQNPVWMFRGKIFCSTIISSKMLGYWHMDRGASYWLVGSPGSELIRCRDLGTMFSADTSIEDVLCVCLKQRILVCGTKEGKILMYYLSDSFFVSTDTNDNFRREFDRVPDLTIRAKERPIRDISLEFTEDSVFIYTWPYLSNSGPGTKGHFQCIVLTEGDWVTETDRDLI